MIRRQLRRGQVLPFFGKKAPSLVGMKACATAHHWARELDALGHRVRLMPPRYVKLHVKRNKNDSADVEAICEAVTRYGLQVVLERPQEMVQTQWDKSFRRGNPESDV